MPASRSYLITQFIDGDDEGGAISDGQALADTLGYADGVRYFIGQVERAPTTNRYHLQGYVEFVQPKSLGFIKATTAIAIPKLTDLLSLSLLGLTRIFNVPY